MGIAAIFVAGLIIACQSSSTLSVTSPNGAIEIDVAMSEQNQLLYTLEVQGETIVDPSPLGFQFANADAEQTYVAHVFEDTPKSDYLENPEAYEINRYLVTGSDILEADLARSGGQAVILEPATAADEVEYPRYE